MNNQATEEMLKKIEEAKKKRDQFEAKVQQLESRLSEKKKKEDTRKKILVGAFIMDELEQGQSISIASRESMLDHLDGFLKRKTDRQLFGLSISEKEKASS